jgi:hypothetical protein
MASRSGREQSLVMSLSCVASVSLGFLTAQPLQPHEGHWAGYMRLMPGSASFNTLHTMGVLEIPVPFLSLSSFSPIGVGTSAMAVLCLCHLVGQGTQNGHGEQPSKLRSYFLMKRA